VKLLRHVCPLLALVTGCVAPANHPEAKRYPPTRPDDVVIDALYTKKNPDGSEVGIPGPDDDLDMRVRHKDGRPWVNWPVEMTIQTGGRAISAEKGKGPWLYHFTGYTGEDGIVHFYLQPFLTP